MSHSRRDFLKTASSAAAFGIAARMPHLPYDHLHDLPDRPVNWTEPTQQDLRALAMKALDAAKSAGASYGDVRIGTGRVRWSDADKTKITLTRLINTYQFGIRVVADGALGFASSREV